MTKNSKKDVGEPRRGFASDNNATILPEILQAVTDANSGHALAYGADVWTERAVARFRAHFGESAQVFFVFNGTAANVLGIGSLAQSYHAVICADTAHIQNDECGAPEVNLGTKLIPCSTPDGKLTPTLVKPLLRGFGDQHHVQPRVISISQTTEMGTLYQPDEIRGLSRLAHEHQMFLHMDGARISNAAAALGLPLGAFTTNCGVDALSFGGAKNGLLLGEAVVILRPELAEGFSYRRKQAMQLSSKMRFIAAQFERLLTDDLYLRGASHANQMAQTLANQIRGLPGVEITQKVEANGIFVRIPRAIIPALQKQNYFYVWDEARSEVRWMTSHDTRLEDIESFVSALKKLLS